MSETAATTHAEIHRSLGRIEGKLDSLVLTLADHTKDDHFNFQALYTKTDIMQRSIYKALGVISFLGISIPIAIAYFK